MLNEIDFMYDVSALGKVVDLKDQKERPKLEAELLLKGICSSMYKLGPLIYV